MVHTHETCRLHTPWLQANLLTSILHISRPKFLPAPLKAASTAIFKVTSGVQLQLQYMELKIFHPFLVSRMRTRQVVIIVIVYIIQVIVQVADPAAQMKNFLPHLLAVQALGAYPAVAVSSSHHLH